MNTKTVFVLIFAFLVPLRSFPQRGYSSYVACYPQEKITVIILSNVSTLSTESIADDIEKMVFGLPFILRAIEASISADSVDLARYCGNFASDSGRKLTVMKNGQDIFMQLAGNPPFQIYPKGKHRFFGKKVDIQFEFEINDNAIIGLNAERMGQTFHFKKL